LTYLQDLQTGESKEREKPLKKDNEKSAAQRSRLTWREREEGEQKVGEILGRWGLKANALQKNERKRVKWKDQGGKGRGIKSGVRNP